MAENTATRDALALQRTVLANERTLLAYVRTAIALVVAGGSSIHFLGGFAPDALGWALVAAGVLTQLVGIRRFRRVRVILREGRSRDRF